MNIPRFLQPADLHGLAQLAGDGVAGTSRLVEDLHLTISRVSPPLGSPVAGRSRGITGLVYQSIRGINALVGASVNLLARRSIADPREAARSAAREHWLAALNGVIGDHLAATGNRLAVPMQFRAEGREIEIDRERLAGTFAHPRLLITMHGLCMSDLSWGGASGVPARLARRHGYSQLDLRYNSGRAICENARELSSLLEALVSAWPEPVEEIVILAHSMGGLVARGALGEAEAAGQSWPKRLSRIAFLGTPHRGSPLERWGHGVDSLLGLSPYTVPFVRIGGLRSRGITDLRHGAEGALPEAIARNSLAVAATARGKAGRMAGGWLGDGLVPIDSALGRHEDHERSLGIPEANQRVVPGAGHLGLLSHPGVYRHLQGWLAGR